MIPMNAVATMLVARERTDAERPQRSFSKSAPEGSVSRLDLWRLVNADDEHESFTSNRPVAVHSVSRDGG